MAPEIRKVSAERIREELGRILTEGRAALGFRMLAESGLLAATLPAVQWNEHLERSLEQIPAKAPVDFAFAVLLHDLSAEPSGLSAEPHGDVQRIVAALKMSGAEMNHVVSLVKNLPRFRMLRDLSMSELKRFLRLPRFEDHMDLARFCGVASGGDLDAYNFAVSKRRQWTAQDVAPEPLISGVDLIGLGFSPGPMFKEILTRVEDEQLEGRLQTREQAVEFVRGKYWK
jgi:poly(A) polymerase